jgi:hypothetical protein
MRPTTTKLRAVSDPMTSAMGQGVSRALRMARPKDTAKHVARDIGADVRTVERWLAGHAPQLGQFAKLSSVYGAKFVGFVLAPCGTWAERLRMEAELDQVIADAEETINRLKQARQAQKARAK